MAAIKIRCSRPLCSSQTTTRTTPAHHPAGRRFGAAGTRTRGHHDPTRNNPRHDRATALPHRRPVLLSQDPTVCQHPHAHPDPATPRSPHSGATPRPNGPGRPFQRRYYGNHRPVRPGAPFIDVPPLSSPPAHTRDRNGQPMDHPSPPEPGPGR
jgi:hypothetical protein